MKDGTELFNLQLPLSLDCDQGSIGQAQELWANIRPGDTLYIRECPAGEPDAIISELMLQAVDVAGPSASNWGGLSFHLNAKTADGAVISLIHADPRPFDQAIFIPSEQLSGLLKASAYFGKHSDAAQNAVALTKLDEAAKAELEEGIRERRKASAASAAEQAAADTDRRRADEAQRSPDVVDPLQLIHY